MSAVHRVLAALALLVLSTLASAQGSYPDRPIHMIVPLAAASAVDNAARIVAQQMSINMGQQIVIENQPGAAGLIGAERVAKAAPDGYTIGGFNDSIMTMLPNLYGRCRGTSSRISSRCRWSRPSNGVSSSTTTRRTGAPPISSPRRRRTREDLLRSGGNGSPQHIAMALFASNAGITLTHVPYKGATQAALDIASGQVPVGFQGLATVASLVRGASSGSSASPRRRASLSSARCRPCPNRASRVRVQLVVHDHGAGRNAEGDRRRLNAEIVKALADPEVREKLVQQGLTIRGTSAQELGVATRDQLAKYARLFRAGQHHAGLTDGSNTLARTSLSDISFRGAQFPDALSCNRQTNGSQ